MIFVGDHQKLNGVVAPGRQKHLGFCSECNGRLPLTARTVSDHSSIFFWKALKANAA